MKRVLVVFILLIINTLSVFAQDKPEETIKTSDGNIYVGEVVMETEDYLKIVIGKRTIVNIQKSEIVSRTIETIKERNHTISAEVTNFYLLAIGLNYDINFYRKDYFVVGGTGSLGLAGMKIGGYGAYRLAWKDLVKAEVGLGIATEWLVGYTGPYAEIAYRSQRDTRWFYCELSVGSILDVSNNNGVLPYGSFGIGVSF